MTMNVELRIQHSKMELRLAEDSGREYDIEVGKDFVDHVVIRQKHGG